MNKFIIVHMEGNEKVPTWWEEQGDKQVPRTFDNDTDAWKEIIEDYIIHLQSFLDGYRTIEETDKEGPDEWVEKVLVCEDGTMIALEGATIIFDPKRPR